MGAARSGRPTSGVAAKGSRMVTSEPLAGRGDVSRLTGVLESRGIRLFVVIDHSGEAGRVGLELRETKVVIFGNPLAGTPVMERAPLAALDLPLRVLVWADGEQTTMSYTGPAELAARYELDDELAGKLAGNRWGHRRRDRTLVQSQRERASVVEIERVGFSLAEQRFCPLDRVDRLGRFRSGRSAPLVRFCRSARPARLHRCSPSAHGAHSSLPARNTASSARRLGGDNEKQPVSSWSPRWQRFC